MVLDVILQLHVVLDVILVVHGEKKLPEGETAPAVLDEEEDSQDEAEEEADEAEEERHLHNLAGLLEKRGQDIWEDLRTCDRKALYGCGNAGGGTATSA